MGKTGESAIFLICQHSENIDIYEKYIPYLHKAVLINNAPPGHYALFLDRWYICKNNTQFFGTQVEMKNGKAIPKGKLLCKEKVDKLREYFDLPPLDFYLKDMTILNTSKNTHR